MTNHWIDLKNADVVLIMGANPAENHPVSFRWVSEARARGANVIHVDPRFTRTSAQADLFAPLRCGSDIAFLGGMLHYILEGEHIHQDYVLHYTNASHLVADGFAFDPAEGLFSGYDPETNRYDSDAWAMALDEDGVIRKDPTLQHPRCVYQEVRRHFARYDITTVAGATGTPPEILQAVYEAFVQGSVGPGRAGTILYAMGWTQHTVGAQNIRAMSMIQMLLGNMGLAGGGINALRGESNVQGSTDHGLLFHVLPGYLKTPQVDQQTIADYNERWTPTTVEPRSANWWRNTPKYMTSYLKSMFGDAATPENDFAYDWLPKLDAEESYAWQTIFDEMYEGRLRGLFAWGQNPANSSAHASRVRDALGRLDWLVTVNPFSTETAEFWRGPGVDPSAVATEVFALPAAVAFEKEGSVTNSGRWAQWRYEAVPPPGDACADLDIMNALFESVRALYVAEGGAAAEPILHLKWDYFDGRAPAAERIAKEINGYFTGDVRVAGVDYREGDLVPDFTALQDDGTTSSGNWLYCGSFPAPDPITGNRMRRRTREASGIGLNSEWAWAWPLNRRILYNRAGVDLRGQPFDPARPVIQWDGTAWVGDTPDGGQPPLVDRDGHPNDAACLPFIMHPDGVAGLFGKDYLRDGPLPEHYEPVESPLADNPMGHRQRVNPVAHVSPAESGNPVAAPGDPAFPVICTTYRVGEHWQSGAMTRPKAWLNELHPDLFVELDPMLAAHHDIVSGDRVRVQSARGALKAIAIVTRRLKPLTVMGATVHQVGLPIHYGWLAPGAPAVRLAAVNLLTPNVGDPNTRIPEFKAFLVAIAKVEEDGS